MKKVLGSAFGIQGYEKPQEDLAFGWAAVAPSGRKETVNFRAARGTAQARGARSGPAARERGPQGLQRLLLSFH